MEVIGWLYQFYISERKDEVFAGFKKNRKAGAAEIPAATQLFTPHWIVRYLVENSIGRLWMLNHPESSLVDRMDYYMAPVDEETDFLKVETPEDLTVIDPARGSRYFFARGCTIPRGDVRGLQGVEKYLESRGRFDYKGAVTSPPRASSQPADNENGAEPGQN